MGLNGAKYDEDNPHIWKAFEECALKMVNRGRQYSSARTILHHLRWESDVRGTGEFKVCNDISAYYSRKFARKYQDHSTFFKMKESQFDITHRIGLNTGEIALGAKAFQQSLM